MLVLLLSCTPAIQGVADEASLRPAGSPDVLLITVSGHCTDCADPYNGEYLSSRGAPQALAAAIEDEGLSVGTWTYADELYSWQLGGEVLVYGFLALLADLEWVEENWIADFDNPTRVVIAAHSHGVVWAHSAAAAMDHVPIEVLIDLDGVCLNWEDDDWALGVGDDWNQKIDAYEERRGRLAWFDLSNPCDSWDLGTGAWLNIDDIVPWNVATNLEVRSSDWLLYDSQSNRRYDGSVDTRTFLSDDNHMGTVDPNGESMGWVTQELRSALRVQPR